MPSTVDCPKHVTGTTTKATKPAAMPSPLPNISTANIPELLPTGSNLGIWKLRVYSACRSQGCHALLERAPKADDAFEVQKDALVHHLLLSTVDAGLAYAHMDKAHAHEIYAALQHLDTTAGDSSTAPTCQVFSAHPGYTSGYVYDYTPDYTHGYTHRDVRRYSGYWGPYYTRYQNYY